MKPWYKGFQGEIEEIPGKGFSHSGLYDVLDDTTLEITELPIQKWTRDFKNFLEEKAGEVNAGDEEKEDHVDEIRE